MKYIKTFLLVVALAVFVAQDIYAQDQPKQEQVTLKNTEIKVKGVGCSGDADRILTNIQKTAGVSTCKITKFGAVTKYNISYDASKVSLEDIYKAVENTDGCADQAPKPYTVKRK